MRCDAKEREREEERARRVCRQRKTAHSFSSFRTTQRPVRDPVSPSISSRAAPSLPQSPSSDILVAGPPLYPAPKLFLLLPLPLLLLLLTTFFFFFFFCCFFFFLLQTSETSEKLAPTIHTHKSSKAVCRDRDPPAPKAAANTLTSTRKAELALKSPPKKSRKNSKNSWKSCKLETTVEAPLSNSRLSHSLSLSLSRCCAELPENTRVLAANSSYKNAHKKQMLLSLVFCLSRLGPRTSPSSFTGTNLRITRQ